MSLRTTLVVTIGMLATLAVSAVVGLVLITRRFDDIAILLRTSVESVRVAQQLEIDLLLHNRMSDGLARARLENSLRNKLAEADHYVGSAPEDEVLTLVEHSIGGYLHTWHQAEAANSAVDQISTATHTELERAFAALGQLVDVNVRQARAAEGRVNAWARRSSIAGTAFAVALVVGVLAVLLWLRTYALQPVLKIKDAMQRFGRGERSARASVHSPTELSEMADQFNQMAFALSRQYENQLAFLAGVAHDLRTPLSTLRVSASLIKPDGELPPDEQIRRLMGIVQRQIERLDRMVGDFLDATRIEAGQLELRIERVDACRIVAEVHELFKAASAGHELRLSVPAEALMIECDALRIEQVLTNLVSNAIKYSPDGGRIELSLRRVGEAVILSVSDQGMGIPPDEVHSIFEPFRRSSASREAIAGVGLGLSVSRRIVEAHHGRLEVESTPGIGSTFTVRLALAIAPSMRASDTGPR